MLKLLLLLLLLLLVAGTTALPTTQLTQHVAKRVCFFLFHKYKLSLYGGVAQIYPDISSGVRTQAAAAAAAAQCICMHEDSKQQQIFFYKKCTQAYNNTSCVMLVPRKSSCENKVAKHDLQSPGPTPAPDTPKLAH